MFYSITEMDGQFYVAPLDAASNGSFLIVCRSKAAAESVQQRLGSGSLPRPTDDPSKFMEAGTASNGTTPIYRLK